jgi:hypothetical protein
VSPAPDAACTAASVANGRCLVPFPPLLADALTYHVPDRVSLARAEAVEEPLASNSDPATQPSIARMHTLSLPPATPEG